MNNHNSLISQNEDTNPTNNSLGIIEKTQKSLELLRTPEADFEEFSIRTAIICRLIETNDTSFVKIEIRNTENSKKIDFQNTSEHSLVKNESGSALDMRPYILEHLLSSESPSIKESIKIKGIKIILWITLFRLLGNDDEYALLSYENGEDIWVEKTDLDTKLALLMEKENYLSWSSDGEL